MLTETAPKPEMTTRQRLALVALDVALLAEVTLSVYLASHNPDTFTPVFMKAFFGLALPTLVAGIVAIRRLGRCNRQAAA
jgi:hypothetical protein